VQLSPRVGRAAGAFVGMAVTDVKLYVVAGAVRLVVKAGAQMAA